MLLLLVQKLVKNVVDRLSDGNAAVRQLAVDAMRHRLQALALALVERVEEVDQMAEEFVVDQALSEVVVNLRRQHQVDQQLVHQRNVRPLRVREDLVVVVVVAPSVKDLNIITEDSPNSSDIGQRAEQVDGDHVQRVLEALRVVEQRTTDHAKTGGPTPWIQTHPSARGACCASCRAPPPRPREKSRSECRRSAASSKGGHDAAERAHLRREFSRDPRTLQSGKRDQNLLLFGRAGVVERRYPSVNAGGNTAKVVGKRTSEQHAEPFLRHLLALRVEAVALLVRMLLDLLLRHRLILGDPGLQVIHRSQNARRG